MTTPTEVLEAGAYPGVLPFMAMQLVDSALATTREFWRTKYFGATEAEANDPRPWSELMAERQASRRGGEA